MLLSAETNTFLARAVPTESRTILRNSDLECGSPAAAFLIDQHGSILGESQEEWQPPVTAEPQKMEMAPPIVALESLRHRTTPKPPHVTQPCGAPPAS